MKKITLIILFIYAFGVNAQNPGSIDPSFSVGTGPDLYIHDMTVQADGKVLIGGDFANFAGINRANLVRLHRNGGIDFDFNSNIGSGPDNYVNVMKVQADGKLLIAGEFTTFNGTSVPRMVRLNTDGTIDNTFVPGAGVDNTIHALVIQSDGKIIVAGSFITYDGNTVNSIVRINANGSIDNSFSVGSGFDADVYELALQSDGKVLVGGNFSTYDGTTRIKVARLNTDGTLDTSFDPATGPDSSPNCLVQQADGKILMSGWFFDYDGNSVNHLVRLNTDGTIDGSFNIGTSAENPPYDMILQPDGKIILGGSFYDFFGTNRENIARLNNDGTLDTSFDPGTGANMSVCKVAFQAPGKIIIAGDFGDYDGTSVGKVARLYSAETIDVSAISDSVFCAGNSFTVSYTQTGTFNSGNIFKAELSDANGSFASPVVMGTLTSTTAGTINATIPTNTPSGSGYRVRVSSTNPATYSIDYNTDIIISAAPTANAGADQSKCKNNEVSTLSGSRTIATGSTWTTNGTGTFGNANALSTTYTPSGADLTTGVVVLTLTTTGNGLCAAASDQMLIVYTNAPTVNAGPDASVCEDITAINLNGSVTVATGGIWSTSGTGTFSNATALNTTYTPSAADRSAGSVILTLTTSGNGTCNSVSDALTITFLPLPVVSGGANQSLCLGNGFTPTGSGALTYTWNNGLSNGSPFVPTSAGTVMYTVTGVDANGCFNTASLTVTVNPLPTVSGGANVSFCLGAKTTLNGSGALIYTWDNGITNGVPFTPTSAGVTTYTVTGTDANGCSNTASTVVTVYDLPSVSAGADVTVCLGNSVTLSGSGAVNYTWTNGIIDGVPFEPSATGTQSYTVTGTDGNSCTNTDVVDVTVSDLPSISVTKVNTTCSQNIGKITATVTGASPFTYVWSNGSNTNIADSLISGLYHLQVADNNGCESSVTTEITSTDGPSVSLVSQTNVSCAGGNDGSISVNITGGTGAYFTSWSTGETATTLTGLSAGTYMIFVSDSTLCETVKEFVITQPDPITATFTTTPAACGATDGDITVSPSGGTGTYSYLWSANAASQVTATASNLGAGVYSVTVTDANTCNATFSQLLETNSPGVTLQVDSIKNGTCSNPQGAIYVSVTSGTVSSYLWSNGSTTEDITGVIPGTYTLLATDGAGCTSVLSAEVVNTNNYIPTICMVTVDTTTFDNQVIWDKQNGNGVAYFNIYCEIGAYNNYQLIATIPYNDYSVFTHIGANPNVKSWKYKISSVDSCGNESPLSDYHKTIHLQAVPSGSFMQLSWDNYNGFSYSTYAIYRSDAPYTSWIYVDNLAWCGASVCYNSYTDTPPASNSIYMIEIDHPTGCNPSKAVSKTRSNIRSGSSRVRNNVAVKHAANTPSFEVYPNPANESVTITLDADGNEGHITILNAVGTSVYSVKASQNTVVDVNTLPVGIYMVEMDVKGNKAYKKLVIN